MKIPSAVERVEGKYTIPNWDFSKPIKDASSIIILNEIQQDDWNRFNGLRIANFLAVYSNLWKAIRIPEERLDNFKVCGTDTLYLYPANASSNAWRLLYLLGSALGADEVGFTVDQNGNTILRCWWD